MRQRIVVGLLAIPLVLVPMWLGGFWALLLMLVVGVGGGLEFYQLTQRGGYHPSRWLGLGWIVALIASHWPPVALSFSLVVMVGLILTLLGAMFERSDPMHTWMATSIGALYLGTMLGQALALRMVSNGLWWILFGLIVTWTNDTAAYFVGVTWGRHKLWPRLSPRKTWEGTIGGWAAAAFMGSGLVFWSPISPEDGPVFGFVVGALCGVFALFGDLAVSTLKRQVGAKDSGHFLPGHGGMLDRMDSLLFVLPMVYQLVVLWGSRS